MIIFNTHPSMLIPGLTLPHYAISELDYVFTLASVLYIHTCSCYLLISVLSLQLELPQLLGLGKSFCFFEGQLCWIKYSWLAGFFFQHFQHLREGDPGLRGGFHFL